MKFAEAIAFIQRSGLENAKEIVDFLNTYFTEIEEGYKTKNQSLAEQVEALLKAASAEGAELGDRLTDAVKKIDTLTVQVQEKDNLLANKETEFNQLQRQRLVEQTAFLTKANLTVLNKLLTEEEKIVISNDNKVTIDGKEIKDWAETKHKEFLPSLLPQTKTQTPDLPQGGSNGGTPEPPQSTVDAHFAKNYAKPSFA